MPNTLISFEEVLVQMDAMWRRLHYEYTQRVASGLFIADQMNWERPEFDDVA